MSKNIDSKIHFIHNKRIMLDRDLATIYQVDVRTLNRAVAKNLERLPKDFMLRLAKKEAKEAANWLKMLEAAEIVKPEILLPFHREINEIIAILVASVKNSQNKS